MKNLQDNFLYLSIKKYKTMFDSIIFDFYNNCNVQQQLSINIRKIDNINKANSKYNKKEKILKKLYLQKNQLQELVIIKNYIEDLYTIYHLLNREYNLENISDFSQEIEYKLLYIKNKLNNIKNIAPLNQKYDKNQALITIRAGAGGVDATDFALILMKMYIKWAQKKDYKIDIIDISHSEESKGVKSVSLKIKERYAYGKLSTESGTHRLVRISPFDSQRRRHTSFAAVEVIPLINKEINFHISDSELRFDYFRSSGPGGQSVNTTDSAVRITHIPSKIMVSIQKHKSQIKNKVEAMRILKSRMLIMKKEKDKKAEKSFKKNISASWGDQVRNYILNPYQIVKDLRTGYESKNIKSIFRGEIDEFINKGIYWRFKKDLE